MDGTMKRVMKISVGVALAAASVLALGSQAQAGILTLTADGISKGFTLSTFATLNPGFFFSDTFGTFIYAFSLHGAVLISTC